MTSLASLIKAYDVRGVTPDPFSPEVARAIGAAFADVVGGPRVVIGRDMRPSGPELVVDLWGDALVAFAWQCVLGVVTGVAAATGKDARGNLLVPVELIASARGVGIVPMARHRFSGSSGLKPAVVTRR